MSEGDQRPTADPTSAQNSYKIEEGLCDLIVEYLRKHGPRYLGRLVDRDEGGDLDPVERADILAQLVRLQPGSFSLSVYWEDIGGLLDDEPVEGDTQGWTATISPRHDPHARAAALAYARSCEEARPNLAVELRSEVYACQSEPDPNRGDE